MLGLPQMPQQPGEPQVNGMHPPSTAGVNWFLLPVSECKCAHGTVRDFFVLISLDLGLLEADVVPCLLQLLDELQPYASGGREP